MPLETPDMEELETLTEKYGDKRDTEAKIRSFLRIERLFKIQGLKTSGYYLYSNGDLN